MLILKPLRYCQSRGMSAYEQEGDCSTFAAKVVEGMSFCEHHGNLIVRGLEDSGAELITETQAAKKVREVG